MADTVTTTDIVARALAEDVGDGDVTTQATVPAGAASGLIAVTNAGGTAESKMNFGDGPRGPNIANA